MNYNSEEKKRFLKIAKKIYLCIVRNRGERIDRLTLDTSLNNNLGLDGDDVDELLNDIEKYVHIDWSAFNFYHYFNDEGTNLSGFFRLTFGFPLWILLQLFGFLFKLLNFKIDMKKYSRYFFGKGKHDFKIRNLLMAGFLGKWTESESTSIPIEIELKAWQNEFQFRLQSKFSSLK